MNNQENLNGQNGPLPEESDDSKKERIKIINAYNKLSNIPNVMAKDSQEEIEEIIRNIKAYKELENKDIK